MFYDEIIETVGEGISRCYETCGWV